MLYGPGIVSVVSGPRELGKNETHTKVWYSIILSLEGSKLSLPINHLER